MPWYPDLFSASVLERIRSQAADARAAAPVPYFDGITSGETDALIGSFTAEPELHHPVRGRVRGRRAFERFVTDINAWLTARHAEFSPVERILTPRRTIEETIMTLDAERGRVEVPVVVAADRNDDGRIIELRIYWSMWPITGEHHHRAPLLEPEPDLRAPDVVGDYQRALAAGDAEAIVATFEPDAYVREPAGSAYVHRGHDELFALYQRFFSNGGGVLLEHCALTDDDRVCALEYNVLRWGRAELSPEAGLAVYVRGRSGKLASARIYDDLEPPLGR
ncbi:MAG: nuclear transport factor 2 family protein [Solirubrobacterales bacterium]|nr:nuclear transport factor 2 family protein [Solirubrobacterales bacterium]MBV8944150.1 nuclear transport factor 2 family protein [Solirubrobacterales bacterium]MBV9364015.1 nuclear transport factor 2 family protein [Solirubrobacterales bacterium]